MATYQAGNASVDVFPSMKGFHSRIKRDLATIHPTVGVTLAAPDTRRFGKQLQSRLAGQSPRVEVQITANQAQLHKAEKALVAAEQRMAGARNQVTDATARQEIAERGLTETRAKGTASGSQMAAAELRVAQAKRATAAATHDAANAEHALRSARADRGQAKLDVDTDNARTTLQRFSAEAASRFRVRIGVDADTGAARTTLATFAATGRRLAQITGSVDVDTGMAAAKVMAFSAFAKANLAAGIGLGVSSGVAVAGAALLALPGLIAVAAGAMAALGVGVSGVGEALKAYGQAQDTAGASAAAMATKQQSAARAIASARTQIDQAKQGEARAYEDAAWAAAAATKRVTEAERSKINAERAALRARSDLNAAYEDARRSLRALHFEVEGGALAEREAVLDLAEARQTLTDAQQAAAADPASEAAAESLARAQVAYDRQDLSLRQIQARNQELTADRAAADAAGIEGSTQVIAAHEGVRAATDRVAEAEAGIAEAREAQRQQGVQSQRAIIDAQAGVAAAQAQLTQAIADSHTAGAAGVDKVGQAMAKLSPNAAQFVSTVQALKPAFREMKLEVQDALFAGLGPAMSDLSARILPSVTTNLGMVATAINGVTKDMFAFLGTGPVIDQMGTLFAGIGGVITALGPVMQTFLSLFLQLANAAMPGIIALVQAIGTIGTSIMTAMQPLIDSGVFTQAIVALADVFAALGPVIGTVLAVAVQLMAVLGPILSDLLTALNPALQMLGDILIMMAPAIGQIAQLFVAALVPIMSALQPLLAALMPVLVQIVEAGFAILVPIVQALVPVLTALMPVVQLLLGLFMELWEILAPIIIQLGQQLAAVITMLAPIIGQLIATFAPFIAQLFTQLAPVLTQVVSLVGQALMSALQILMPLLPPLMAAFTSIVTALMPLVPLLIDIVGQIVVALLPILPMLAQLFLQLIAAVLPILPPLLQLAQALLPTIVLVLQTLMPILQVVANIFSGVLAFAINTFVLPTLNLLVGVVRVLGDIFNWLWSVVIKPVWDAISGAIQHVWDTVLEPIFTWIGDKATWVGEAFKRMGDTIGGIWDGIKRLVRDGIQAIIDFVWNDGLMVVVNGVIDWVPGVEPLSPIILPQFATGGVAPGYAPGKDTLLAAVSPGEGFLVPEAVRLLGGPAGIAAINRRAMAGAGRVPGPGTGGLAFATGGVVGAATGTAPAASAAAETAVSVSVDPAALTALTGGVDGTTAAFTALATQLATATTPALTALSVQLTALTTQLAVVVMPALFALDAMTITLTVSMQLLAGNLAITWTQITTTIVTAHNTLAARQFLLQNQFAVSWQGITDHTWASVNAQRTALAHLDAGLAATRGAMAFTADWAASQFARVRAAAADPIRWVLEFPINAGLVAAWNKLDGDFALGKPIQPVAIGFAGGGRLHGPGTGTSDSIAARLPDGTPLAMSNGEYVVREAVTRRVLPFLDALNSGQPEAMQAAGAGRRRFAGGGLVDVHGQQVGAALARGIEFARRESGKPYIWGGVGPAGYDCSGFMSAITNVLRGEHPHRRLGVARSQPWAGFAPGLGGAFATGYSTGHTAGTLAGVNVESGGSPSRVKYGVGAVGADHAQFGGHAFLPVVGGQFVPGGDGAMLDPRALVDGAFADAVRMIGDTGRFFPGNHAGVIGAGVAGKAVDAVKGKAVERISAMLTTVGGGGAGVEQWRGVVLQALAMLGQPASLADTTLRRMNQESGGNPRAINNWDINARRGIPSKGLMQVIDPTFRSNWDPRTPNDIWHPLSNVVASMRYALGRYGSLSAAYNKAGGYDGGGLAVGRGLMLKNVLRPERVLDPDTTVAFDQFVSYLTRGHLELHPAGGQDDDRPRVEVTQNIHPAPGQDERAIAANASRRIVHVAASL